MFKNVSRRKALLILLVVFVVLGLLYYIFVSQNFRLGSKSATLPPTFPADTVGPWQSYVWKGKLFGYPNDWSIDIKKNGSGEVESFIVFPKEKKEGGDFIGVGGGTCATIRAVLCLGVEPVYTNSRDSNVLIVYNTIIKHITQVEE